MRYIDRETNKIKYTAIFFMVLMDFVIAFVKTVFAGSIIIFGIVLFVLLFGGSKESEHPSNKNGSAIESGAKDF